MTELTPPAAIFEQMYRHDAFSQWLGIELVEVHAGTCVLRMQVRPDMVNGFGVAHGGISFSLADSVFAFACNSRGRHAVSIHCSIEHSAPVQVGDVLTAIATEDNVGNSVSNYAVRVEKQDGTPVAFFRGVAYRKKTNWEAV
jgi:acyl-CoA thioesterase